MTHQEDKHVLEIRRPSRAACLNEAQSKAFVDLVVKQGALLEAGGEQTARDRPERWWRLYAWTRYLLQRLRWRLFGEPAVKIIRFKSTHFKIDRRKRDDGEVQQDARERSTEKPSGAQ